MKIITIDGHPGAGKSTQTKRLLEHYSELNIGEMGDKFRETHGLMKAAFVLADFGHLLDDMTELLRCAIPYRLMVSHAKEHGYDMLFIEEYFGTYCLRFANNIRLFRDMLTARSGIEPVASFYIDVPENELARRRVNREAQLYNAGVSIDLW